MCAQKLFHFQQIREPNGSTKTLHSSKSENQMEVQNLLKELLFTYLFTNMLPINDEYYFGMIANAATSEK
jgi:hypothetical protein